MSRGGARRRTVAAGGRRTGTLVHMVMTGLDEFEAELDKLIFAVSEKAIEESLVEAAEPLAEEAQLRAARASVPSKGPQIGHMADSIRVHQLGFLGGVMTVAVTYDREHYWGTFLEVGAPHMAPQPFLRPTWEVLGPTRLPAFLEALGRRIEAQVPGFRSGQGR